MDLSYESFENFEEHEITAFTVLDINMYNKILMNIIKNDSGLELLYEKCIYYGFDNDDTCIRMVCTSKDPICPVAFYSFSDKYEYKFSVKHRVGDKIRNVTPVWKDDCMLMISSTSKSAREYVLPREWFVKFSTTKPDDLTGKYRKELIIDRVCIIEKNAPINDATGEMACKFGKCHRFTLCKKSKFVGNGIYRQPDVHVYMIDYEIEFDNEIWSKSRASINYTCHRFIYMCTRLLQMTNEFYYMIRSGQTNGLPENDLFISIFNSYNREFSNQMPTQDARSNDEITFACPKWDGIRAIGLWRGGSLLLYSGQFGFKYFDRLPRIFSPDVICQVEYFHKSDSFIVTELFACVNIEMDTDYVYFLRRYGNSCRFGEGLYNGSNTSVQLQKNHNFLIIDINQMDSVIAVNYLHKKYPKLFTVNRKLSNVPRNFDNVRDLFDDIVGLHTIVNQSSITDGVLVKHFTGANVHNPVLCIEQSYKCVYYKLKKYQTVELLYNCKDCTFVSRDGTNYNDMIIMDNHIMSNGQLDEFKFVKHACRENKLNSLFEFTIYPGNRNEHAVDEPRHCMGLIYKCIRYDKMEPDDDCKIMNLINIK